MIHSIGYLGPFAPNFDDLHKITIQYTKHDGTLGNCDEQSDNASGIFFGYLEKPNRNFFAVRAQYGEVLVDLANPVELNPRRHMDGKRPGPKPPQFGDECAANLLRDMISANASQADALSAIAANTGLTVAT
ncbi:hypothetical protein [Planctomycetes bacterium K23_9]|uniref:Uncharacterized protein n=1 Tax=Stieleria marina TaxID=1930275 RepID=A0A517NV38_9BACT|nr:hypothetical protein K239x_29800 [Planctomycetes bacterium K23_9]